VDHFDEARRDEARRNRLSLLFLLAGPGTDAGPATMRATHGSAAGDEVKIEATDQNALVFSRTVSQVIKTAYGERPASGAFYTGGLNGAIK
jgi:hypothetical protein